MKGLETGKDKIQKICDAIKRETLEPARQEAAEIVENARAQAEEILKRAKEKEAKALKEVEAEIEERRKVFYASLQMACRQGIEDLKQKLEKTLFSPELEATVKAEMKDPKVIAGLINSLMRSVEEKGIEDDFEAIIPKHISARSISALLTEKVLERLEGKVVPIGDFEGGAQVKISGRRMTIDMSDQAVRELIAEYIRRDLRDLVFNA